LAPAFVVGAFACRQIKADCTGTMAKKPAAQSGKRMTVAEKYASLKRQTERAGMTVKEENGKLVVSRKPSGGKKG
jgi:hypothetical protein